ncbi:chymotrypsin-1-like [Spodoptera litura]|uniref:Chymotrypsin-1-like n=1 Tax=Spodoptera litura TaxID=69820 RepID=A0A9J7EGG3_SPOLT|nr:chymotrypsin-1-like [Spodoptera litura]
MVALSFGVQVRSFLCGASLITQRTVLTAAHCIHIVNSENGLIDSFRVSVGSNQWNSGTEYAGAYIVTHPDFDIRTIKHDIGVLITSTIVVLNNLVQTVPVTYDYIGGGVEAILGGWGRIRAGGSLSRELLELRTTSLDGADCMIHAARLSVVLRMRHVPPVDPHVEVCAFHSAGFGACNGDSGSALRRASDGHQFGIVSWGFPCALGAPDMYVRISSYQIWLKSVIV